MNIELDVKELLKWKEDAKILYASQHNQFGSRQLFATANGGFQVFVNHELKHESLQATSAVDYYNNINLKSLCHATTNE